MLIHPQIDPVALHLGPLKVHWYGLMYMAAFIAFMLLGRWRARARPDLGWQPHELEDLLFWGVLGVVLGGRLGQVLLYEPAYYFAKPLEIFAVWKGGMAFHGGLIGVLLVLWYYARKTGRGFLQVGDFVAPLVPLGLAFGRIGNFINGELWGRPAPADLPWAMIYPHVDDLPRHPSQIYQMLGEGLLLFVIVWLYARAPRPVGAVSGVFLIGYGALRFTAEFYRTPDPGIFSFITPYLTNAQWLCVPMALIGLWLLLRAHRAAPPA